MLIRRPQICLCSNDDQTEDAIVLPWTSSGWTHDKSVLKLLDIMAARGEVVVVGREGQHRLWDLAERVLPDDPVPPIEEATA